MRGSVGHRAFSQAMIRRFSQAARERIHLEEGGYRRDHLRVLAQRVEVADDEIRIMGSQTGLLRPLSAAQGRKLAAIGVPRGELKWRKRWDSNPRMLAHRRFSRPEQSTTLPPFRYQHS